MRTTPSTIPDASALAERERPWSCVLAANVFWGYNSTTTNGLADGGYYEQIEVLAKFTIGPIHDFFATRKFADFPSFVVVLRNSIIFEGKDRKQRKDVIK